ncbi:hypothetical protein EA462_08305 [Natrarchaeobius halalkaliphilus]|uniref:DUF8159 domain-containing protein n=1 Tax=Natrarchaeobius halalkaliphilus TaxID=1679091 RepID=A0A3N6NYR0_9EURY|nr:hypothetical protein [Natrarchaeobius halalkaliphilus]RQG89999.1 hypothetical protein EA462_08305 [Natrarchaeobius halalkaliphilus]
MSDLAAAGVTLENRLMSHGIYVIDFERDERTVSIEYEVVASAPAVTTDEVGAVVRTLLTVADEREWAPGRLEATSRTTDGDVRGHWHVEKEWFDRLSSDLTELEFSNLVLGTITDDPIEE